MYPFLKKIGSHRYIKLHKELYPADIIDRIKKSEPDAIAAVKADNKHMLIELASKEIDDYFDFLNYLIYHKKNQ